MVLMAGLTMVQGRRKLRAWKVYHERAIQEQRGGDLVAHLLQGIGGADRVPRFGI